MSGVLGGDSSISEGAEGAERGDVPLAGGAEAGGTSQRWPVTIEVEDASKDEADSRSPAVFRSAPFQPQT
jgi:hypothetical protein